MSTTTDIQMTNQRGRVGLSQCRSLCERFRKALVTGAIALLRDRERSLAVWLSTLLPVPAVGLAILEVVSALT